MKWIEQFDFNQVSNLNFLVVYIRVLVNKTKFKKQRVWNKRTLEARSSSNSYRITGVMFNKTGEHDSLES
jgi:hypothetical protein